MKPQINLDRYFVHEKIGEGAFGEVYRATHKLLDREVAIKFIKSGLTEKSRHRFVQEARSVARLNHPHILQVYDFEVVGDDQYFMAMEYLPDGDLESLLEKRRLLKEPFALPDVLLIIKSVAVGLHHAHRQGIIHRDIKPSNIFFSSDQRVVIGDFGLAKQLDGAATQTLEEGGLAGTPGYLSPEQIQGLAADHRSDIYALGVIMYQLLAGERPYKGELHAVLIHHLQSPVPDLAEVRPDLPPRVAAIIKRAMAKDPDARYQNMKSLIEDLNDLAAAITDSDRTLVIANPDDLSASLVSFSNLSVLRPRAAQPQKPAWRLVGQIVPLMLILMLIAGGLAFGAGLFTNAKDDTITTDDPTDLIGSIAFAEPDEVLVLVAQMEDDATGINIGDLIYEQFRNGDLAVMLANSLRIERLSGPITDSDTARIVGLQTNADVVVWGTRNAAGWEIRVEGPGRPETMIQDLRLFVIDDEQFSAKIVQSAPSVVDYFVRAMLISSAIDNNNMVDTLWLTLSFRAVPDTDLFDLAMRPLDRAVLMAPYDAMHGNLAAADTQLTNLLSTTPDDKALLMLRWSVNLINGQLSRSEGDARRISELIGPDNEMDSALFVTTYYVFGQSEQLFDAAEDIYHSDSPTARFAQNEMLEFMIQRGDFAEALRVGEQDPVTFLGRILLLYAIQGDGIQISANLPDYLDQRTDLFIQEANTFFQGINPANLLPVSFATNAYGMYLAGQDTTAQLTLSFALTLHPDDYLLNWMLAGLLAEGGEYQAAYDRYDAAAVNATVPFPIARFEQAQLVWVAGDALENPIGVCKLLQEAADLANTDADFYAVLLARIGELRDTAGC